MLWNIVTIDDRLLERSQFTDGLRQHGESEVDESGHIHVHRIVVDLGHALRSSQINDLYVINSYLIICNLRVHPDPDHGMRSTGRVIELGCTNSSFILEHGAELEDVLILFYWVLNTAHELIGRWLHPDGSLVRKIHRDNGIGFTHRYRHKRFFLLLA